MLFNSPEFIFLFLPATLILFYSLRQINARFSMIWLCAASLLFYGYWNYKFLSILIGSIIFNYLIGRMIVSCKERATPLAAKFILISGISVDLLLLAYYKYINFFIGISNQVTSSHFSLLDVALPLGISFFTFTQIAYLVDCFRSEAKEYNFINYALFVTYFPHLIAGPILHHKEMLPQFNNPATFKRYFSILPGLTMFAIGLCKKIYFADNIAVLANTQFNAAQVGDIATIEAWAGALAYTMQIYFDFSAYSDMAIGISFMFGIKLPVNFNSPYKSTNIIEFWRRWHMTLSRFLRDYLYIPLGGNRKGNLRRYLNVIITMLLGGLWHGAGYTYLIWGALHGCYLAINHGWQSLCAKFHLNFSASLFRLSAFLLTFLCVTIAWVFFRAADTPTALNFLRSMFGGQVHHITAKGLTTSDEISLAALILIAWLMPNSLQIMQQVDMALLNSKEFFQGIQRWYQWRLLPLYGVLSGFLFSIGIYGVLAMGENVEFLYFQF